MIIGKNLLPEADLSNLVATDCRFIRTNEFPITNLNDESATKSAYLEVTDPSGASLHDFGATTDTIMAYRPHPLLGHSGTGTVEIGYGSPVRRARIRLENSIDYIVTRPEDLLGAIDAISIFLPAGETIWRIDDLMFVERLEFDRKPNIGYTVRDIDLSTTNTNDFGFVNTIERNTIREVRLDFSLLTRSQTETLRNFFLERKSKPFFLSIDDDEDTFDKRSLAGKFYIPNDREITHLFKDFFSTSLVVREYV